MPQWLSIMAHTAGNVELKQTPEVVKRAQEAYKEVRGQASAHSEGYWWEQCGSRASSSHLAVWQGHHAAHSSLSLRSNKGSLRAQLSLGKEEEVSVRRFEEGKRGGTRLVGL